MQNSVIVFAAQDYNRGFGIIRHNIPKVAAVKVHITAATPNVPKTV